MCSNMIKCECFLQLNPANAWFRYTPRKVRYLVHFTLLPISVTWQSHHQEHLLRQELTFLLQQSGSRAVGSAGDVQCQLRAERSCCTCAGEAPGLLCLCVHLPPPEHPIPAAPPTIRRVSLSNPSSQQRDLQELRNLDGMEGAWFVVRRVVTPSAELCSRCWVMDSRTGYSRGDKIW